MRKLVKQPVQPPELDIAKVQAAVLRQRSIAALARVDLGKVQQVVSHLTPRQAPQPKSAIKLPAEDASRRSAISPTAKSGKSCPGFGYSKFYHES
jgi:hypothetical protein